MDSGCHCERKVRGLNPVTAIDDGREGIQPEIPML